MLIYMKYEGIDGAVTSDGHEKWIELNSFQWRAGRGISQPTGVGDNREASTPSVSEITVTKVTDESSPKLLQEALHGEGKLVKIDFIKTDKCKPEPLMQIELQKTMVSTYSINRGRDRTNESFVLCFEKIFFDDFTLPVNDSADRVVWPFSRLLVD